MYDSTVAWPMTSYRTDIDPEDSEFCVWCLQKNSTHILEVLIYRYIRKDEPILNNIYDSIVAWPMAP